MHALIAITIWGCYLWLLGKNFFIAVLGLRIEHNATPGNIITEFANQKITPWPFFISQFKVVLHYLFMFLWPFSICVDYDWKLCTNIACSDCLLPLFMLISIMATVLWSLIKNKTNLYAFGILWFFICMAPRSTIMPSTELLADYKTYLASIGWLFFLSLLLFTVYRWLSNNYSWCKKQNYHRHLLRKWYHTTQFLNLSTKFNLEVRDCFLARHCTKISKQGPWLQ